MGRARHQQAGLAVSTERIDLQFFLTVKEGCVALYASDTERYPSPKRAKGSSYGYMLEQSTQGCKPKGECPPL